MRARAGRRIERSLAGESGSARSNDSGPGDGPADDGDAIDGEPDHSVTQSRSERDQPWSDKHEPWSDKPEPRSDHGHTRIAGQPRVPDDSRQQYHSSKRIAGDRCDAAVSGWNAARYDTSAFALTA